MKEKLCDKYCHDCIYFQGMTDATCCCHYIIITGERRNCEPGKGCTKKVKRGKKRRLKSDRINERKEAMENGN